MKSHIVRSRVNEHPDLSRASGNFLRTFSEKEYKDTREFKIQSFQVDLEITLGIWTSIFDGYQHTSNI